MFPNKPKVVLAMSGGVDSSVAAKLLLEKGFDVIGVTFQLWPTEENNISACGSFTGIVGAREVADRLEIEHHGHGQATLKQASWGAESLLQPKE